MPYATKEAFKIIRERFSGINKHFSSEHILERGPLATSILGQGFSSKGKRSSAGRFRSSATQQKRAELELQSELFLASSVDINDASPAVSDMKHDLQVNATRDLSSLPSSSTLLQPAREFYGNDYGESDPKTCAKEKYTVTPHAGSVPTLSIGSPLPGPETRQAGMFEDLDLGLRLGTGSKVPKGLIFKDPKP